MRFLRFLNHKTRGLLREEAGLAFVEFVILIPVLLFIFFGCLEISRYILAVQKMEKTSSQIDNIITQTDPTATTPAQFNASLDTLMSAVRYMMYPYDSSGMRVIITDVYNTNTSTSASSAPTPVIKWQYCNTPVGTATQASKLGQVSGSVSDAQFGSAGFPTGATGFMSNMQSNEEVVITEVYYQYIPITNQPLVNASLYRSMAFMPRLGSLASNGYSPNCN